MRFQQKFVDEALPEAMLQADTIFNALTSLDGVLAAKLQVRVKLLQYFYYQVCNNVILQEASLAAQALVEKESREQGIQLQYVSHPLNAHSFSVRI